MSDILERILETKRREIALAKDQLPLEKVIARLSRLDKPRQFSADLKRNAQGIPAVIAEIKKASPSRGLIRPDFDPEAIARAYSSGGAAAISVLTDTEYFQGALGYLELVKKAVGLPVLRKDFLIDRYQIYQSRLTGADAVLLIVAALTPEMLVELLVCAEELQMECLVEVHNSTEMDTAMAAGAKIIGINNRNLRSFETDLTVTLELMEHYKTKRSSTILVSESGIYTSSDMQRLGECGVDAALVGEAIMRSDDIEQKLRELVQ